MLNDQDSLRVVFMGTPPFAADILEEVAQHENVVGVYTQPDRVRSRGKQRQPSAVRERAERLGLEVKCLSHFKDAEDVAALRALDPEVICVAAFGALLPPDVLSIPRLGCLNVHASILPRWRGAAPVERAILAGDEEAGVCIMRMEEGLDTGDWCICRRIPIGDMNAEKLTSELASLGAVALVSALEQLKSGHVHWTVQDAQAATYAHKLERGELFLDPVLGAQENARRVQASSPAHPSKCTIGERPLTVVSARLVTDDGEDIGQGSAKRAGERLLLGCAEGVFELMVVKPDGKREMSAYDFMQGMPALKSGLSWSSL